MSFDAWLIDKLDDSSTPYPESSCFILSVLYPRKQDKNSGGKVCA